MTADRRRRHARAIALLTLCAASAASPAQDGDWALCGGPLVLPERPELEVKPEPGEPPGTMHISADRADMVEGGTSTLIDNVQVERDGAQMQADRVVYKTVDGTIDATGDVQIWKDDLYASGRSAHLNLGTNIAGMGDVGYMMSSAHARGIASHFELEGEEFIRVKDATYTTCNEGEEAWSLEADFIRIDRVEQAGFARNVLVRFHDVPIFYAPVMSFPTGSKRKSGFLAPSFGVTSETGVETTVPYYFNIAPNHDATMAARAMSERGIMLQGEYRYLQPWGHGLLGGEFLHNDKLTDEGRGALHFEHEGDFAENWDAEANFDWVSDPEYFEDLGTDLAISSTRFLEQEAHARYRGRGWQVIGRVQQFQTVDRTILASRRPYDRLPQFEFRTTDREVNRSLNFDFEGEVVHFDRRSSVTGQRYDLVPSVSFPVRSAWSFVIPKVALHHTGYALSGTAAGVDDSPSRTVPTFSTDAGIFLERDVAFGGRSFVQTLEPRAFYLLVPKDGQDDLPVFDTGLYTFSFASLFRENRFNGADRLGDANQLTLALTSRLLDNSDGSEVLRASIGQIRYFRDRDVTLPGRVAETEGSSDLVADAVATLSSRWRIGAGLQWDLDDQETNRSVVSVRWTPDRRRVVNASYRFVRDATEQTDFSFRWPLSNTWSAVGRWNYAPADDRTLEAFAGFEYESCCWALRAVGRRYLSDTSGGYNSGVFLQLELKGLAGVATGESNFLEHSIPGYRPGY